MKDHLIGLIHGCLIMLKDKLDKADPVSKVAISRWINTLALLTKLDKSATDEKFFSEICACFDNLIRKEGVLISVTAIENTRQKVKLASPELHNDKVYEEALHVIQLFRQHLNEGFGNQQTWAKLDVNMVDCISHFLELDDIKSFGATCHFFQDKTQHIVRTRNPVYNDMKSILDRDLPPIEQGRKENETWAEASLRLKKHEQNVCYFILKDDLLTSYMNGESQDYPRLASLLSNGITDKIIRAITDSDLTLYDSYDVVNNILINKYLLDHIPRSHETVIALAAKQNVVQQLIDTNATTQLLTLVCTAYNPLQDKHKATEPNGKRQIYYLKYYNVEEEFFDLIEAPALVSAATAIQTESRVLAPIERDSASSSCSTSMSST